MFVSGRYLISTWRQTESLPSARRNHRKPLRRMMWFGIRITKISLTGCWARIKKGLANWTWYFGKPHDVTTAPNIMSNRIIRNMGVPDVWSQGEDPGHVTRGYFGFRSVETIFGTQLSLYSMSHKALYCLMSRSLEAVGYGYGVIVLLWNWRCVGSAARVLVKFRAIRWYQLNETEWRKYASVK